MGCRGLNAAMEGLRGDAPMVQLHLRVHNDAEAPPPGTPDSTSSANTVPLPPPPTPASIPLPIMTGPNPVRTEPSNCANVQEDLTFSCILHHIGHGLA